MQTKKADMFVTDRGGMRRLVLVGATTREELVEAGLL
jgi:hypothetical protein